MPSHRIRSCGSTGKKHHSDSVFAGRRQCKAKLRTFALEKGVRNLDQNARAVARLRIATACAAMRQINQDLDALQDDVVRFLPLDIGDKAHAAGVMLILGTVKPLSLRQTQKRICRLHFVAIFRLRIFAHRHGNPDNPDLPAKLLKQ